MAEETAEFTAKLSVSPEFCITSNEQLTCEVTVKLEWNNQIPKSICILSDYDNMARWCTEEAEVSSFSLDISTTKDVQFVMIDKVTHETLAGVKLKVTPTAGPKVRRRYRNPWSLF
ncbi:DUF3019 domain-containing protein [Shewanella sp. D64]|uniref:DUF3019 domain-containing protein n=1 Tax=unclassified Shewanella TaxID=196818 RepID=UPI0022BA2CFC|nr:MULTISPECIES: DUF3019 domain-containing protein [unclassified Shewanella]MEC4727287.1 DUF3019 domain-containing protein [Shewanella sp. D64]MEC4739442.1 DUF3019 domain-containing protein [Shewanella sp. E94]WBJ96771.1 DUF3019 domain-containing protein [Shewanella sp. MTB7]